MKTRYASLTFALAALFATSLAHAQTAADPNYADPNYQVQSQPAPIERATPGNVAPGVPYGPRDNSGSITSSQPAAGIFVRTGFAAELQTISATSTGTELRLNRGIANINIHHPAHNSLIQVDLPGGQVNLLKDGLYTFNADTNTVRVLHGEAETQLAGSSKPVKIKEDHAVNFSLPNPRSEEFYPVQARADLLYSPADGDHGYGPYGGLYAGYYGPYGYPYPYYAYGAYPYYYPWGIYPGFGFGFGYIGGGFRGRFR